MLERCGEIETLYFDRGLSVVNVAAELGVTKQYISKVLKNMFGEKYQEEKEKRKMDNNEKRSMIKIKNITEKRRIKNGDDVTIEELRIEHESSVRCLSKSGYLSNRSTVYSNINAYDLKGNNLVYNEKVGKRPNDMPARFSVEIDIY